MIIINLDEEKEEDYNVILYMSPPLRKQHEMVARRPGGPAVWPKEPMGLLTADKCGL